jgi:hypothetical protein
MKQHFLKILLLKELSQAIPIEKVLLLKKREVQVNLNQNLIIINYDFQEITIHINEILLKKWYCFYLTKLDSERLFMES